MRYIKQKKDSYNDGEDIKPEHLMMLALNKYKVLKKQDIWTVKSPKEEQIIVLTDELQKIRDANVKLTGAIKSGSSRMLETAEMGSSKTGSKAKVDIKTKAATSKRTTNGLGRRFLPRTMMPKPRPSMETSIIGVVSILPGCGINSVTVNSSSNKKEMMRVRGVIIVANNAYMQMHSLPYLLILMTMPTRNDS